MRNHLNVHIKELDARIQQVRAMSDNWHRRHQELDQRMIQLNAEHQRRMDELNGDSVIVDAPENNEEEEEEHSGDDYPQNHHVHPFFRDY